MNEAAETGTSLWPAIAIGIYWAYLIMWQAGQKRDGDNSLLNSGPQPTKSTASAETLPASLLPDAAAMAGFDQDSFLSGARRAYEFILHSYAAGETDALVDLLAPDVLEVFRGEIYRRKAAGNTMTLTVVAVRQATIVDSEFDDAAATVQVRFDAELFLSEGNGSEEGAKGPAQLLFTRDLWTFRKAHNSRRNAWTLMATDTA